ncbi:hypothetical protein [Bordetella genomosp. 9]|uniref:hypothetical protein n=1 Tax=Bordetella genomosp. 9 TaxID=1416803 RepID=UPI0012FB39BF|nr:hypothetical protein [Bordetella genomosp. 9]
MNELLTGFIGAELTLLGVPGKSAPAPRQTPAVPKNAATSAGAETAGTDEPGAEPAVRFHQDDYRTAAC